MCDIFISLYLCQYLASVLVVNVLHCIVGSQLEGCGFDSLKWMTALEQALPAPHGRVSVYTVDDNKHGSHVMSHGKK